MPSSKYKRRFSDREIAEFIKQAGVLNPETGLPYSQSTYERRASTVRAWINWIFNVTNN